MNALCFSHLSRERLLAASFSPFFPQKSILVRLDAVPRRTAPGRVRTVTAAWEEELVRVIELDPHEVGQDTANWTTERLAEYLGKYTGVLVTEETVRVYLHAHDYVCKRPTWTLRRKAEEKADYVGNACG